VLRASQWRDLQKDTHRQHHPSVVDREEEIGGLPEVIDRQFKKESLARFPSLSFWLMHRHIVTVLDA